MIPGRGGRGGGPGGRGGSRGGLGPGTGANRITLNAVNSSNGAGGDGGNSGPPPLPAFNGGRGRGRGGSSATIGGGTLNGGGGADPSSFPFGGNATNQSESTTLSGPPNGAFRGGSRGGGGRGGMGTGRGGLISLANTNNTVANNGDVSGGLNTTSSSMCRGGRGGGLRGGRGRGAVAGAFVNGFESTNPSGDAPIAGANVGDRGGRGGGVRGGRGRGCGGLSGAVTGSQSVEGMGSVGEAGRTFGSRGRYGGDGEGGDNRRHGREQQGPADGQIPREPRQRKDNEVPHVPKKRTVEEIWEEDDHVKDKYKIITDEDDDVAVTGPGSHLYNGKETWSEFGFEPGLLVNIERSNYIRPRKIQSLAIPLIQAGCDVKGQAETGSGKSATFLLPIIDDIMKKKKSGEFSSKRDYPYALILEPTRELTNQLYEQTQKLAKDCNVSVSRAYGCFTRHVNIREISVDGCDILIGTPGRLYDFFDNKFLLFEKLKVLVFDEADELLEDNFMIKLRQFEKITGWPSIEKRQTLLFSATFPPIVQEWANDWMKADSMMVSNRKLVAANSRIQQCFVVVGKQNKKDTLLRLLQLELEKARKNSGDPDPKLRKTMVFVNTKREADLTSAFLNQSDLRSTTINGDRPQELREKALNEFRVGIHQVIVTTDVCARGLDIKKLDHVINMDLPNQTPDLAYTIYVQRIGRTGRLTTGYATSFFEPREDLGIAGKLVEGLQDGGLSVPEWLQKAVKQEAFAGQVSVSDQELLTNAGFPPMPPSVPPVLSPLPTMPPNVPPFDFLSISPRPQQQSPPNNVAAVIVEESPIVDLGHPPTVQNEVATEASICPLSPPHDDWE